MPLDPVAAYNLLSEEYARIREERTLYLGAVEDRIAIEAGNSVHSMLDVGSGDGQRATRIAQRIGIKDLTLLEPSAAMRAVWSKDLHVWPIRAEELSEKSGRFDMITCLWNVLGHIFPAVKRRQVLADCARLLAPGGLLFIDVSHRYNMRHYGRLPTLARMIADSVATNVDRGDVPVRWRIGDEEIATIGHVFRTAEVNSMTSGVGLCIEHRFAIDYETGERRSIFGGHLLYKMRRVSESYAPDDFRSSFSPRSTDARTSTMRRAASPSP